MSVVPSPNRRNRRWLETEDHQLQFFWGAKRVEWIAKRLGRTPWGVVHRASALKLGPFEREAISMKRFVELSGYSPSQVKKAARRAGLTLHRATPGSPARSRPKRLFAITEEQQEILLKELLSATSTHLYEDRPGDLRTTKGKWGVGKKPPACVRCGTSSRPHCSKGMCASCYNGILKKQKRAMLKAAAPDLNKEP